MQASASAREWMRMGAPIWAATRRVAGLAALGLALLGALAAARAEPPGSADMRAIRGVIEAQLEALASDDAERAFSYASAEIRERFGSAQRFMAMVRGSYGMLLKPAALTFFVPDSAEQGLVQRVQLRDRHGQRWMAIYQMVPASDGSGGWRINGCVVSPDQSRAPST